MSSTRFEFKSFGYCIRFGLYKYQHVIHKETKHIDILKVLYSFVFSRPILLIRYNEHRRIKFCLTFFSVGVPALYTSVPTTVPTLKLNIISLIETRHLEALLSPVHDFCQIDDMMSDCHCLPCQCIRPTLRVT